MGINPLQIPGYGPALDITPQLSQLTASINQGQKQQTLADLGRGLADGSLDYKQAAAKAASLGDLGSTMSLLKLGQEQAASKAFDNSLSSLYGGGQTQPPAQAGQGGGYGDAIAGIESGGKYDALGPVTRTGDRAYGKYQIMGQNVGPWTQEVLGKAMTPQEFAANPQAQDAVFNAKFGNYVQKYGPEGAARAWFAGEGGMNDLNRKDQLGTSVASYGQKFMAGLPQQAAQAGPQPQAGGISPRARVALQAMANPNLPAAQRAVAKSIFDHEQQIAAQAADPMRQLQMLKLRQDIAKADREPEKGPALVELFDERSGQPYKAIYNPETKGFERIGGVKSPSGMQITTNPDGTVSVTQGPVGAGKPLTEAQSKDMVFVTRAVGAMPVVDKLGDNLTSGVQAGVGAIPGVGNYLKSKEYQQAAQAGKEFLQAILRKDTGAAITKEETAEYGSVYLPQPGDSKALLAQKKASRQRAVQAIQLGLPPQSIIALEKAGVKLVGNPSAGSPPAAAVTALRSNPALKAQFDAKYGAGASDRALGGQ